MRLSLSSHFISIWKEVSQQLGLLPPDWHKHRKPKQAWTNFLSKINSTTHWTRSPGTRKGEKACRCKIKYCMTSFWSGFKEHCDINCIKFHLFCLYLHQGVECRCCSSDTGLIKKRTAQIHSSVRDVQPTYRFAEAPRHCNYAEYLYCLPVDLWGLPKLSRIIVFQEQAWSTTTHLEKPSSCSFFSDTAIRVGLHIGCGYLQSPSAQISNWRILSQFDTFLGKNHQLLCCAFDLYPLIALQRITVTMSETAVYNESKGMQGSALLCRQEVGIMTDLL